MAELILEVDERTCLLGPDPAFAGSIFGILQEQYAYLRPWLPWIDQVRSLEDTRHLLREFAAYNQGGQRLITYIFYEQQLVGSIGLMRIDGLHQRGEIGYWLMRQYQGKGIITNCCRTLTDHAFRRLSLNRLEIRVPSDNAPSRGVPHRLGFRHEGTLRQNIRLDDTFHDLEVFSLLREDWEKM